MSVTPQVHDEPIKPDALDPAQLAVAHLVEQTPHTSTTGLLAWAASVVVVDDHLHTVTSLVEVNLFRAQTTLSILLNKESLDVRQSEPIAVDLPVQLPALP